MRRLRCDGGVLMNQTRRVAQTKCEKAEEVEVSFEKEMPGVRRRRPGAKGKGNGGKGEHRSKGGTGSKGTHQVSNMMKGEDDKKDEVHQRGDDECQETKVRAGLSTTRGKEKT